MGYLRSRQRDFAQDNAYNRNSFPYFRQLNQKRRLMMNKLSLICMIIGVLAMPVFAQSGTIFSINLGACMPYAPEEFTDYWKTGFNIGCGIGAPQSNNVTFIGAINYTSFSLNDDKLLGDNSLNGYGYNIDGGAASTLTTFADFKFSFTSDGSKAAPYLLCGVGIFRLAFSDATISYQGQYARLDGDSETKLGIEIGTGLDIDIDTRTSLSLGAKYVIGFTEDEDTQYFPLQIGLIYK